MTAEFHIIESAIRQLQSRYVDALWRKDYDALGNCFTENAEWRLGGKVLRGRAEIVANQKRLEAHFRCELLTMGTPLLEVGDGTAFGRTYFSEQGVLADGRAITPLCTSFDRFVDQGDQWRIAWSLCQTHCIGPPDFSGTFIDNRDYGPHPAMPPPDAIPSASSPTSKLSGVTEKNSR